MKLLNNNRSTKNIKWEKLIILGVLCTFCSCFAACGSFTRTAESPKESDISTWEIPDNARFVPTDNYTIDDNTINGMEFTIFVDLENGTMWLHTDKFQGGYGTTMVKLTDENNEACIYEDLEQLREQFNYKD